MHSPAYGKTFCRAVQRTVSRPFRLLPLWLAALTFFVQPAQAQTIQLSVQSAPLTTVFKAVEQQTPYRFIYTKEELAMAKPVTIKMAGATLEQVLQRCFAGQPLTYSVVDQFIKVQQKLQLGKEPPTPAPNWTVKGTVQNEKGEAIPGATVSIKHANRATATDVEGQFLLEDVAPQAVLQVSSVGYASREWVVKEPAPVVITLSVLVSQLDEAIVIAYGATTRRLNTGSVDRVSAAVIGQQPVSNPLAALQGRVPGLLITQSSGVPGAAIKVELRGRNSIAQGADPLFVIDGVPFAPGNNPANQLRSAAFIPLSDAGGISPLNSLNPDDIESIEILKDADATAIYGSRGANGVILITTKKGKAGHTTVKGGLHFGISQVTRSMAFMDTRQYLQMRREAFANDNITPSSISGDPGFAPDLLLWDTTRYTDFRDLLIGGTAQALTANAAVSGGNSTTQFLLSSGYSRQTTVFPGDMAVQQGSLHVSVQHQALEQKLRLAFSSNYNSTRHNMIVSDLAAYQFLPPNAPVLVNADGKLNWSEAGISFTDLGFENPLSYLFRTYRNVTDNLVSHLQLNYQLLPSLTLRSNLGYNVFHTAEQAATPNRSLDPEAGVLGSAQFAGSTQKSWTLEPQVEYVRRRGQGKGQVLLGAAFQENKAASDAVTGYDYTNDALLGAIRGAQSLTGSNNASHYRYQGLFARVNGNWGDKYLLNLSGRRDGSSRFGPGRQFGYFGAVGAAWVFSEEKPFAEKTKVLSFGKLRASYGTSGNDQIGDYRYLQTWDPLTLPYQGEVGLAPTRLYNPAYSWEVTRKLEVALETGWMTDRLMASIALYRNRSANQLIEYRLPIQAGFSSVFQNLPALVENKGFEFQLTSHTINRSAFAWTTTFNLGFTRNKLLSFPDLSTSSYGALYEIGQPLSVIKGFRFKGMDATNGLFVFEDIDKDGQWTYPQDYQVLGSLQPRYYGGVLQDLRLKDWKLSVFLEFRKQTGRNYISNLVHNFPLSIPGFFTNQPVIAAERWQQPGDNSAWQRYTTTYGSPAYERVNQLLFSDGIYSDASYIRLKNLSLSYDWQIKHRQLKSVTNLQLYLRAQNLLTITRYKGADPENQNLFILPPLQTIVAGFQLTL